MRFQGVELTLNNLGAWPTTARTIVLIAAGLLTFTLGFFFDIQSQLSTLEATQQLEQETKQQLEQNALALVKAQKESVEFKQMQAMTIELNKELIPTSKITDVLDEISKIGSSNHLKFQLVKPLPPIKQDFLKIQPVQIIIVGTHHDLANFLSQIANLHYLITVNAFTITHVLAENTNLNLPGVSTSDLQMDLTLNIHYTA